MKSILISIKPKWCAKIMNGNKTIEVRKNKALANAIQKLIDENGYADIYVYCSKLQNGKLNTLCKMKNGKYKIISNANDVLKQIDEIEKAKFTGKVVFKFRCYKVEEITVKKWNICVENTLLKKSCLHESELFHYIGDFRKEPFYAIHISDLEIFDKPKELSEFRHSVWVSNEYIFPNPMCDMCKFPNCKKCERHYWLVPLTKAPQNFCYVEVE